jgi:hypothetical protein
LTCAELWTLDRWWEHLVAANVLDVGLCWSEMKVVEDSSQHQKQRNEYDEDSKQQHSELEIFKT